MKRIHSIAMMLLLVAGSIRADGLLMPVDNEYPQDFLKNRLTQVEVNIHGLAAETIVYQEFVNEWDRAVDAVYSFPLPPDARATQFLYWFDNKVYRAVLKVREQAVNPGTGEGGVVAEVNRYIGRNGIKVALKGVPAGKIQKVKLFYVQHLDYYASTASYVYPLATGDFITHPLDHLQFSINVESSSSITEFDAPGYTDYTMLENSGNRLRLEIIRPKAYVKNDFMFNFSTQQDQLGVDFYSVANDSMDGHFALYVRPPNVASNTDVFPKRMIFIVSTSSNMFGYKLDQCIKAVTASLDLLESRDQFNILVYNYSTTTWKSAPVAASAANITQAKQYLQTLSSSWGSQMDAALQSALAQISNEAYINSILVFTDGRSPLDPRTIESQNRFKAGIFPVGIGNDLDRARLEMTAGLNYGFVTYFDETANINAGVFRLFQKISRPLLKDVAMEFGRADLHDILPAKLPAAFVGSYFFLTGRYSTPSSSALAMAGKTVSGTAAFDFRLDFASQKTINKFAEHVWAKEKIDALEREVEIYGEDEALRQQLIELSLRYNIRCRYTAYVADYTSEYSGVKDRATDLTVPHSFLLNNYPNPFNPSTTISFYIAVGAGKTKLIKIYNALGQLVAVFDVSDYPAGFHQIRFDGVDFSGKPLPSGLYFARLQVGDEVSTLRLLLQK
jgi:Ca-activated chloride channel homolog